MTPLEKETLIRNAYHHLMVGDIITAARETKIEEMNVISIEAQNSDKYHALMIWTRVPISLQAYLPGSTVLRYDEVEGGVRVVFNLFTGGTYTLLVNRPIPC